MKGPSLPLKMFISLVLIVAAVIVAIEKRRDIAMASDGVATHPVDGQDHPSSNRPHGTNLLRTSVVPQQRELSKKSSNIGETALLGDTKIHAFLRDGASATQKKEDGVISGVDIVPASDASLQDGLVEVECSGETSTFTTEVLLEVIGDPSLVSQSDVLALQSTFVTVYNDLTSMFCDDQHRMLLNATIVEIIDNDNDVADNNGNASPPNRRGLQMRALYGAPNDKMGYWPLPIIHATLPPSDTSRPFYFRFLVSGRCNGCPPDGKIYDDVTQRHLVETVLELITTRQQPQDLHISLGRGLQEDDGSDNSDDKCYCPVNPVASGLPTADEFTAAIEKAVVELDLDGVQSVPEVIEQPVSSLSPSMTPQDPTFPPNVAELPVDCSSDEGLFETEASIEFTGTPDFLQPFEIAAVENAFPSTYNRLASAYCDAQFREVLTATVVDIVDSVPPASTRMLQESGTANILNGTNTTNTTLATLPPRPIFRGFQFRFVVTGRCLGCPRDASLFDDVRRKLEVQLNSIQTGARRYLQGNNNDGQTDGEQEGNGVDGDHQCFCPENTPAFRAPSAGEFENAFGEQVRELDLPNIQTVANVTGTPAAVSDVPSSIPSASPSWNQTAYLEDLIRSRLPSVSLQDSTSPESKAFFWMIQDDEPLDWNRALQESPQPDQDNNDEDDNDDTAASTDEDAVADDRFLQRFVVAAFTFSIPAFSSWRGNENECTWGGTMLTCDSSNKVVSIRMTSEATSGSIPVSIGLLSHLMELRLNGKGLTGTIPPEMGMLQQLAGLYIYKTNIGGPIPEELGTMRSLTVFSASSNSFTGRIPTGLGQLTRLTSLDLSGNMLTGPIPGQFSSLSQLTLLNLSSNSIIGPLPTELGFLRDLVQLDVHSNNVNGAIPAKLCELNKLKTLELSGNAMSGGLPPELGDMSGLQTLSLSKNSLTGGLPTTLGKLTGLNSLSLYGNGITGDVPQSICDAGMTLAVDCDSVGCACCVSQDGKHCPTPSPTPAPVINPTPGPTTNPTPVPTLDSAPVPRMDPTPSPPIKPTQRPTSGPTPEPTMEPTPIPTWDPTLVPTMEATPEPTVEPTPSPTIEPTSEPAPDQTPQPTMDPTLIPHATANNGPHTHSYTRTNRSTRVLQRCFRSRLSPRRRFRQGAAGIHCRYLCRLLQGVSSW